MYQIYPDTPLHEREEMLKQQAVKQQQKTYGRTLTHAEVDAEKGKYAQQAIDRERLQKELKNIQDDYKNKIANIDKMMEEGLEKIKTGKYEVTGWLYGLPNYNENRMLFYDKFGELIDSRDLLPDEYQGKMFTGQPGSKEQPATEKPENEKGVKQIGGPQKRLEGPKDRNDDHIADAEYEEVDEEAERLKKEEEEKNNANKKEKGARSSRSRKPTADKPDTNKPGDKKKPRGKR